jgi:hypothetical protein
VQHLTEEDPLIPKKDHNKNVIKSVSGICNLYYKYSLDDMFTGAHVAEIGADHSGGNITVRQSPRKESQKNKDSMKTKFKEWGINLKWVVLFPHINDFNGREPGQNFLGSVSRTVIDDSIIGGLPVECVTKRRMTMTFCQQKVHEDTEQREMCASKIHEVLWQWKNNPAGTKQNDDDIKEYAKQIRYAAMKICSTKQHTTTSACIILSFPPVNGKLRNDFNLVCIVK